MASKNEPSKLFETPDAVASETQTPERVHWKLFETDGALILHTYNKGKALRACFRDLEDLRIISDPLAMTSYSGSGKKGGSIASFLLGPDKDEVFRRAKALGRKLRITPLPEGFQDGDRTIHDFNVTAQVSGGFYFTSLRNAILHDIQTFCEGHESKTPGEGEGIQRVRSVNYEPRFRGYQPSMGALVKRGKGTYYDICNLMLGIEISRGCGANMTPDGFFHPENLCEYCYAESQNMTSLIDTLYRFDQEYLEAAIAEAIQKQGLEERPIIFRIGQTVDPFVPETLHPLPGYSEPLEVILETLAKHRRDINLRATASVVTKFPNFSPQIAEQMRGTAALLVSIGYDQLERGALAHGYSVERRLEEALIFAEAGVKTGFFVATDITRGMNEMQEGAKRALAYVEKHPELGIEFLDARITKRCLAPLIGGAPWGELKPSYGQVGMFSGGEDRWAYTGEHHLGAARTHPDFLRYQRSKGNIRLCSTHVPSEQQACGYCFAMPREV